jgi:hypothetical protein
VLDDRPAAYAKDQVIHAGHLLDGGVEAGYISPAGAEVIDLSTATGLLVLIDSHVLETYDLR